MPKLHYDKCKKAELKGSSEDFCCLLGYLSLYQTKLTGDRHMSIFCSWTCMYDEQTHRDNREFYDIANTADAYMALMTP